MKRGRAAFAAAVHNARWREHDAEVVLEEWSISGLELEEFARRHELHPVRLRRWSERLGRREALRFHPVELRFDEHSTRERARGDSGVELVLVGGRRVAVRREFDEELLARVVRVVESWSW